MSKYNFLHQLEEDEECKELKDYPGYFVTTKGRVWSNIKGKGRWLSQYKQGDYYWGVMVGGRNGGNKLIHQLVGRNFLKDYKVGMHILHKNELLNYPNVNFLDNLYVGGEFTNANSNPARNIAKWNPTGSGSWSSLSSGVDGTPNDDYSVVNSIAIDSANNVYVGGYFYTAGSNIINNLAKWNPSGSGSWSNLNVQVGYEVRKLYCKNQQLYITTEVAYNTDTSPGFIIWNT